MYKVPVVDESVRALFQNDRQKKSQNVTRPYLSIYLRQIDKNSFKKYILRVTD